MSWDLLGKVKKNREKHVSKAIVEMSPLINGVHSNIPDL